jgi:hypothetical protein
MDFSWASYFNAFWIFPLLCLFFMAVMVIACGGMLFRFRHGCRTCDGREAPRQTGNCRCVNGEIGKG